jgi:hypothetical protein
MSRTLRSAPIAEFSDAKVLNVVTQSSAFSKMFCIAE